MSSDPPPPDNPPPPTIVPLGQPLVEAASPTSHPSAASAPSEPPSEDFRQAFALSQRVLQLGPAREDFVKGLDWFILATSLANAIGDGYLSIMNLPDVQARLTNLPNFTDINNSFNNSVMSTAARLHATSDAFQQELTNWRHHEIRTAKNRLEPEIQAEVEKWRASRFDFLMNKAAQEAETLADVRTAQSRSRAKTRGDPPHSPTPRRQNSSLGKRILTVSATDDSEMDLSDSSSTSLPDRPDITRTPRAKRSNLPKNPPTGPPPQMVAAPPSNPMLASFAALLEQSLGPILQRISSLEKKRMTPEFTFRHQLPPSNNPTTTPTPKPPSQPLPASSTPQNDTQAAFTPVPHGRKKGKNTPSYASAAAAPPQAPPKPNTKPLANPPQCSPKSTEITVQRPPLPAKPKATRRSADGIVASVQLTLREAKSDIPLLFGRWAAHTNNFVYVFSGDIPYSRIQQIGKYLLQPFPEGTLAPVGGWSRILLSGIPTSDDSGTRYSEATVEAALRLNPVLERIQFVMPPRWLLRPEDMSKQYAPVTFSIHDPDGSLTKEILQSPIGVFGAHALPRRFESCPPLRQCARCHRLGHMASDQACQLKRDAIHCYLCGGAHPGDDHPTNCRRANNHQEHGICDCPVKCINCRKVGHHALDLACPDRARFRIPGRNAADPNANPNPPVPHV